MVVLLASDYDKSKYFKGADLNRAKKFRIKAVTPAELTNSAGEKEEKLVVWFTNDKRGLPLNKTNLRTLSGAFGDSTADWIGKVIVLFPIIADNGKPGLRIRILPPKPAAAAATPQQPVTSGNGAALPAVAPVVAAAPPAAAVVVDPELDDPDPVKTHDEEIDDEILY